MARKACKPTQLQPRLRVTSGKDIAFGPGKADLLEQIATTGSIRKAATQLDMSYMRAWSLVKTMNRCFSELLIESSRGGSEKGGAHLTPTGARVLELYRQMEASTHDAVQSDWLEFQMLLKT